MTNSHQERSSTTLRKIFLFWVSSMLICGFNGALIYTLAPRAAENANSIITSGLTGLIGGVICSSLMTLMIAIAASAWRLIKRPDSRRAPGGKT